MPRLQTFILLIAIIALSGWIHGDTVNAQTATPTPTPITISTVNDTSITDADLQTRLDIEAWLITREIEGFARTFYAQNPDTDSLLQTLGTVYAAQLATLNDTEAFAETVLNSMEIDLLLRELAFEQGISVTEEAVNALILEHITLADGIAETVTEDEIEIFYAMAEIELGITPETVYALFEGRVLREVFYRAVTNTVDGETVTEEQNLAFQQWAFDLLQIAEITRVEGWEILLEDRDYGEQVTGASATILVDGLTP
jgi:hypothetical protein